MRGFYIKLAVFECTDRTPQFPRGTFSREALVQIESVLWGTHQAIVRSPFLTFMHTNMK